MKQYVITIIGAAVLSGIAHILTPSGWVKYVKLITGLVILCVICAPITSITKIDLFSDFSMENYNIDENVQIDTITAELKKRIETDISDRIRTEFSKEAKVQAQISVNENNEITGVTNIKIQTDANPERVVLRMCEVYGIKSDEVEVYEP